MGEKRNKKGRLKFQPSSGKANAAINRKTVTNLNTKISRNIKDIIQKYASGLFKDATLEFYGIKTAPIKEIINVELPTVEVSEAAADFVFLLEDGSYLHFEFQSTYNKSDLARFAAYDLHLYGRDGRRIETVIIYTASVAAADTQLHIGSLAYNPDKIMMREYDGNALYVGLSGKIQAGEALTDVDMLNLMFLPLMRHSLPAGELAAESIKLAQTIPDTTKRNACIAAAFAFANRYLNEVQAERLLEVLRMTDLATMLIDEKMVEVAKNAIKERLPIGTIIKITGLDESTIRGLQAELDD